MNINEEVFKSPEGSLTDAEVRILAELYLSMDKGERPSELKEATRMSQPTLHKYLNILVLKQLIKKEISQQPREYPHPVFYTLVDSEKALKFAESSYEWVHQHEGVFNELEYAKRVLRVTLSKLLNKNIDEIPLKNNVYKLAEELRQYIAQALKSRDPTQLKEEDIEFIRIADARKKYEMKNGFYPISDFFTAGVYPKRKCTKKKQVS